MGASPRSSPHPRATAAAGRHLWIEHHSCVPRRQCLAKPKPCRGESCGCRCSGVGHPEAGLYVILTIGCNGENGSIHSMDFARDFWSLYAPRYKDETHVIFEAAQRTSLVHPKPVDGARLESTGRAVPPHPRPSARVTDFAGLIYGFRRGPNVWHQSSRSQWGDLGQLRALAHHGYESKTGIESTIASVQSGPNGPALLNTEFWPGDTEGQGYNSMYESHLNGWMQFQWLGAEDAELDLFRAKITQAGTIWTPDAPEAMWPAKGAAVFPNENEEFGLYQRGAERFVRSVPPISPS